MSYVEVDFVVFVVLTESSGFGERFGIGPAELDGDRRILRVPGEQFVGVVKSSRVDYHFCVPFGFFLKMLSKPHIFNEEEYEFGKENKRIILKVSLVDPIC